MNKEYTYRLGTKSDIKKLQALGLISYGQFKNTLTEENWKKMEDNFSKEETFIDLLDIATCFVCEQKEDIIGMAFLIPHGNPNHLFGADCCYIRLVGVHPKYEGKGIGRKLTEMCVAFAKQSGEKIIALHTSEFQHAARHIYESLGFSKIKEFENLGKTFWIYTLNIN
jgi:GNAT superfamily N-acetyltransferase